MTIHITHAELEELHPDQLIEIIDNMEETALFEGTMSQDDCTTDEQVRTWSAEQRIQHILSISNLEKPKAKPALIDSDISPEVIKDRKALVDQQAIEIETLKAQLADKALIIENLNIEVTELNKAVNNATHELKVEQGKASRQQAWDKRTIERKTKSINNKKQKIADMEAKIYSQTDIIATFKTQDTMRHEQANYQAGLIEDMEVNNKALREQNDYLKATLKSVL